jgi:acetylornithine deacetylase/succinyl-diaminopimelate desuccinylase-like protein
LAEFLLTHKELLEADLVVVSDTPMLGHDLPSICYGLRGICYLQVEIQGPGHDLHSGSFGGAVPNPLNVLVELLAALHDQEGRITIPGFYDQVFPLTEEERQSLAALPFDEEEFQRTTGVPALDGEMGYTTLERVWGRPTLDVNGILGGFTGEGPKTVIPSLAMAKVSMRLVPDQRPDEIADLFEEYLESLCPPTVCMTMKRLHEGRPFLAPIDHPIFSAASRALEQAYGWPAGFIREGGSIPFVTTISEALDSLVCW